MNLRFKMHGEYKFNIEHNIFIIDITGPCNKEFFEHLHQGIVEMAAKHQLVGFATLVVVRGDALITTEIFDFHVDFLKEMSVSLLAVNLEYCDTAALTEAMCHKAYANAGIKHQFFNNNQAAKDWLNSQLQSAS